MQPDLRTSGLKYQNPIASLLLPWSKLLPLPGPLQSLLILFFQHTHCKHNATIPASVGFPAQSGLWVLLTPSSSPWFGHHGLAPVSQRRSSGLTGLLYIFSPLPESVCRSSQVWQAASCHSSQLQWHPHGKPSQNTST